MIAFDEHLPSNFELNPERDIEVVDHPCGGYTTAWPRKGSTIRLYVGRFPDRTAAERFLNPRHEAPQSPAQG